MNLPFLVDCDNDRVIAQTNAIFSYLGRELNMMGSNPIEQSICEELLCEIMDIRNQMVRFAYAPRSETDEEDAKQLLNKDGGVLRGFDKIELYLKRKKESSYNNDIGTIHLVGDRVSAPSFHLWEMLDQFEGLTKFYRLPSLLEPDRPHLAAFKNTIESLPEVSPYLSSEYSKIPFNNPYARFGSNPTTLGKYERGMKTPWKQKGIVKMLRSKSSISGHKHR
jgi:glutathione S-transferase